MASALAALTNATVAFRVAGVGVVTDPDTGNVTPAEVIVTVPLFLNASRARVLNYPGIDNAEFTYDGYAIEKLDPRITIGTTGTLTFAGETPVACEVKAVRLPYGKTGLLGSTLNSVLGERIQLVSEVQG